mgnify:CR=1 FL=1
MKIVFVAHEFGFYKGHGGIAAYLYNIVKYILDNYDDYKVYVITYRYDTNCGLLQNEKLNIIKIRNEIETIKNLEDINPNYVEVADYDAMCLKAMIKKHIGEKFTQTVFAVHHHTALRECFIWNSKLLIKYAVPYIKTQFERERTQILLSDIQIAPSNFMANYVKQNYYVNQEIKVYNHYIYNNYKTKEELQNQFKDIYDIDNYEDSFNVILISRIEGRKNQKYLIEEFIKFKEENNIENANLFLVGNSNIDEITGEEAVYEIYREIEEKYLDYIHFYNFADLKTKNLFLSISDITVLPSYYENFPIAIAETVLIGIPVIASKNSGVCDYIDKSYQFNPFKKGELAKALYKFYKMKSEERKHILEIQKNTLLEITNPKKNIESRLELFKNYKNKYIEKKFNYRIIEIKDLINKNVSPFKENDCLVFIPNKNNKKNVIEFISDFKYNENIIDKIIILNSKYIALDSIKDIASHQLPIIIPEAYKIKNTKDIVFSILEYIYLNFHLLVQIKIEDMKIEYDDRTQLYKKCIEVETRFENNNILEALYNE